MITKEDIIRALQRIAREDPEYRWPSPRGPRCQITHIGLLFKRPDGSTAPLPWAVCDLADLQKILIDYDKQKDPGGAKMVFEEPRPKPPEKRVPALDDGEVPF